MRINGAWWCKKMRSVRFVTMGITKTKTWSFSVAIAISLCTRNATGLTRFLIMIGSATTVGLLITNVVFKLNAYYAPSGEVPWSLQASSQRMSTSWGITMRLQKRKVSVTPILSQVLLGNKVRVRLTSRLSLTKMKTRKKIKLHAVRDKSFNSSNEKTRTMHSAKS